jgi:hypothetical protein
MNYFAFRDETGLLDADDLSKLQTPAWAKEINVAAAFYLQNPAAYAREVGVRYEAFLDEVGQGESDELHALILTSMISGMLTPLSSWLATRHGPGAFAALFKTKTNSGVRSTAATWTPKRRAR